MSAVNVNVNVDVSVSVSVNLTSKSILKSVGESILLCLNRDAK